MNAKVARFQDVVRTTNSVQRGNIINESDIINNYATGSGGGIYCNNSAPLIEHVTITENEAYSGGGVYLKDGSNPAIINSIIWGNIHDVSQLDSHYSLDENGFAISCKKSKNIYI